MKRKRIWSLFILIAAVMSLAACDLVPPVESVGQNFSSEESTLSISTSQFLDIHTQDISSLNLDDLIARQEYAATLDADKTDLDRLSYRIVNGNKPFFSSSLYTTDEFELYSDLDSLGRCGMAFANISPYTLPTVERENISSVKPSGWVNKKYDCVPNKYLYNRCHLIGFQLAAENANEKNLITGTRFLNIQGMVGFENAVARYVKETGNHVLYAATPIFSSDELVARGVLLEAYSVEDNGNGIEFCVFCYNNQPHVVIDYTTGASHEVT